MDYDEEIRREAYQVYLRRTRNGQRGDEKSDWAEAELIIQSRRAIERERNRLNEYV